MVPSDSSGGGHSMSEPNSQERRSEPPFSATLRAPFLFRDRWPIPAQRHAGAVKPHIQSDKPFFLPIRLRFSRAADTQSGATERLTVVRLRQVLVVRLAQVGVAQVGVRQVRDVRVRQRVGQPPGVAAAAALRGRGGGGGGAQVGGAQLGGPAHPVLHARHVVARPRLLLRARRRV